MLRAFAAKAGDLPVDTVQKPVEEPEYERQNVETERYGYQTQRARTEARSGEGVAGDTLTGQGAGGQPVERLGALAQFLVEHPSIIAARARFGGRAGSGRVPGMMLPLFRTRWWREGTESWK